MSLAEISPWSVETFFRWQTEQEGRYELVGGYPLKMMTGASQRHDVIVTNLLIALGNRLRGGRCRPFTADGSVETLPGQIRRPDVGVDCGRLDPDGFAATAPTVVFEVLSPSTRDFDRLRKVVEYKRVETMQHIVIIEPRQPLMTIWSRGPAGDWSPQSIMGLDGALDLPAIGIAIPLREIYDRLSFEEAG
ncbi:Uma2 family endonuclease [Mangrovibrevibacter kandeliae]|uniref:Uma2 family endonuclease n=1 Tax=Mangrovibrevibacter kandeliae TaxID=2968473 RepID=UPI002118F687|nr:MULTISPECIES: Uma2 family endonuclease [unclassified Aurantimonas]MCQ8782305.1 Uma2 family endonuclease [Aurantimonas sp. CSK15Z-1]MCW4115049.1 Uma2 family endonuclease [Aurantimonas sp. MSK8Z-1]